MKKLIILLLAIALTPLARAGLIFDNGTGDKNDTLVIQFCFLDSAGLDYASWDTAYIRQCYGGVAFNQVTLTSPATYDIGGSWPSTMMFEWRSRASDSVGHIGAYTWWALVTKNYNGKRVRQMHKGWYYVNNDPIEDFLVAGDTASNSPLYDFINGDGSEGIDADIGNPSADSTRVAWAIDDSLGNGTVPDSLIARVDSIRWAVGMPTDSTGNNLHRKIGPYSGGDDNVKNAIDALSLTGGGTEACTLLVKQDSSAAIQSARIVIRTLDQSTTKVPGLFTDVDGKGITELDAASYFISITANNYVPLADTLIVSNDASWLFNMTPFDPGNPPSPELCRVYGWVYDIGGENLANVTISAEIPSEYQPMKYGDVIITPFKKSICSDSTGYWEIDLFPNSILSLPDSKYQFVIEYPSGVIMKSKVAVPDTVSWQFR
jgi:hypothetical protein